MTTATEIQAVATVESLLNPIDQLFVLDRQQKTLAAQVKTLKDTIANTYDVSAKDAAGKIIAKTGWIKRGYTLSGIIKAKDGVDLVFAVYAHGKVDDSTKLAIDNFVTAVYRCGNQLSNN